jgi:hypothetical protein
MAGWSSWKPAAPNSITSNSTKAARKAADWPCCLSRLWFRAPDEAPTSAQPRWCKAQRRGDKRLRSSNTNRSC